MTCRSMKDEYRNIIMLGRVMDLLGHNTDPSTPGYDVDALQGLHVAQECVRELWVGECMMIYAMSIHGDTVKEFPFEK